MNRKEQELIAVFASVAAGCEPCTQHHVKAAREAGADPAELRRMVETALTVRERATRRMAAVAWGELGVPAEGPTCAGASLPRLEALAAAACALAASCGSGVPGFLAEAVRAGAAERDAEVALGIARQIKKVAAEKAEEAARGAGSGEGGATRSCCSAVTQQAPHACC